MAVTYITRIYATIDKSLDYIVRDKAVLQGLDNVDSKDYELKDDKVILTNRAMELQLKNEALQSADKYLENAIDYIERDKELSSSDGKVEIRKTLTSTINCTYDRAKDEFKAVSELFKGNNITVGHNKKDILGYHVWQSFEEEIDGELANKIGMELAHELYGDCQCVVSTHTNTHHTHNHIVFNATKLDGSKYHLNTTNTRKLREVSDRLCEEYGLNVLQHTKDMKLTWYKDEAGNWKCFEPTERKSQIEKGEYSDKNDYRNYEAYLNSEQYKESNASIIKKDIDKFIGQCKSLDDLISKLENIGYEVKNLNSKGEYLKYISFKAPSQGKFTRGKADTLGEDYTREGIVRRIESNKSRTVEDEKTLNDGLDRTEQAPHPNHHTEFNYNNVNIDDIDEEKRKRYNKVKSSWEWVRRSELEKYVIKDVKHRNKQLDEFYKQAQYRKPQDKKYYGKNAEHYKTIDRINDSLRALQFLENRNIQSFQQINDTVKSLHEKSQQIDNELSKIRNYLKTMNTDIVLIKQYNDLKHSIEVNSSNPEYRMYELQGDKALLERYEEILKAKKLTEVQQQADYIKKYENYTGRFNELVEAKERINHMINDYDLTVRTIDRVDRDYDRKYRADIKEYYNISKNDNHSSSKKRER